MLHLSQLFAGKFRGPSKVLVRDSVLLGIVPKGARIQTNVDLER